MGSFVAKVDQGSCLWTRRNIWVRWRRCVRRFVGLLGARIPPSLKRRSAGRRCREFGWSVHRARPASRFRHASIPVPHWLQLWNVNKSSLERRAPRRRGPQNNASKHQDPKATAGYAYAPSTLSCFPNPLCDTPYLTRLRLARLIVLPFRADDCLLDRTRDLHLVATRDITCMMGAKPRETIAQAQGVCKTTEGHGELEWLENP